MKATKIKNIHFFEAVSDETRPIMDATHSISTIKFIITEIELESGVTGRNSANFANEFNIPVLPHFYKDYDVPLLCTVPNGPGVESFDWIDPLIDNPLKIQNGVVFPRDLPGWGFAFIHNRLNYLEV